MSEVRVAGETDRTAIAGLRNAWAEEKVGAPIEDDPFEARFDEWFEREHDQR